MIVRRAIKNDAIVAGGGAIEVRHSLVHPDSHTSIDMRHLILPGCRESYRLRSACLPPCPLPPLPSFLFFPFLQVCQFASYRPSAHTEAREESRSMGCRE